MQIRLAVFDLAGTTVNDEDSVGKCLRASLREAGLVVDRDQVNAVMGIAKPIAIRKLIEASPAHAHLLPKVDEIHANFVKSMIRFYQTDPSVYETPGTSEMFARLKQAGIQVAVDTGFSRDITRIVLDRLGWEKRGLIQGSITSDEVKRGRPHPDMIQALMARLHVKDTKEVAKIGDTPSDLEEGTNAECGMVVGVTKGSHTREQLQPYPHTHLIGTIAEFPTLVGL